MSRLNVIHAGLMFTALGLAYVLPFRLVLLSYAVLGPAHYLTEISWLHERSYFLPRRTWAWLPAALTLLVLVHGFSPRPSAFLLCCAFGVSAALVLTKQRLPRTLAFCVTLGVAIGLASRVSTSFVLVALLTTVVHVALFTFLFMLNGALRARSGAQLLLTGLYVAGIAVILAAPPIAGLQGKDQDASVYFGSVSTALGILLGTGPWKLDARLAGMLSYMYTYHYLNWFIKVNVVKWHDVSKTRLAFAALLSAVATGLYFIDYALGLNVLLSLSLLHVVLEFPLNAVTIRDLSNRLIHWPSAAAVSGVREPVDR
jgi:hypothetical protein